MTAVTLVVVTTQLAVSLDRLERELARPPIPPKCIRVVNSLEKYEALCKRIRAQRGL